MSELVDAAAASTPAPESTTPAPAAAGTGKKGKKGGGVKEGPKFGRVKVRITSALCVNLFIK